MGYVKGKGLGKDNRGRVLPVEAHILPGRKSLDHCMHLKKAKRIRKVGDSMKVQSSKRAKYDDKAEFDGSPCSRKQSGTSSSAVKNSGNFSDVFQFMNNSIASRRKGDKKSDTDKSKCSSNLEEVAQSRFNFFPFL